MNDHSISVCIYDPGGKKRICDLKQIIWCNILRENNHCNSMPAATGGEGQSSTLATVVSHSQVQNAFGARDREQESLKIGLLQIVTYVCV